MKRRIVIADDDPIIVSLVTLRLGMARYEVLSASNGPAALALIRKSEPLAVILDIQMPGRSGLRIASEIQGESRPEIIFITAHEQYAADAFDVDAADYLLKPVRFDRLRQAVNRARRRRDINEQALQAGRLASEVEALRVSASSGTEAGFWVPERQGQRRVPIDTIAWIEAARDYVLLHTDTRSHMLRTTMAALEEKLAGTALVRVHRSAFVRPDKVAEVRRANRSVTLVLTDGANVQVGPSYVDTLTELLGLP